MDIDDGVGAVCTVRRDPGTLQVASISYNLSCIKEFALRPLAPYIP